MTSAELKMWAETRLANWEHSDTTSDIAAAVLALFAERDELGKQRDAWRTQVTDADAEAIRQGDAKAAAEAKLAEAEKRIAEQNDTMTRGHAYWTARLAEAERHLGLWRQGRDAGVVAVIDRAEAAEAKLAEAERERDALKAENEDLRGRSYFNAMRAAEAKLAEAVKELESERTYHYEKAARAAARGIAVGLEVGKKETEEILDGAAKDMAEAWHATKRAQAAEARVEALEKALRLAESLLRHLFTTGQTPVKWALHPDSPPPQEVINAVCAALARKEGPSGT